MGLELFCPEPDGPLPREVHMRLTCDFEHGADLYTEPGTPSQVYTELTYPQMRSAAARDGWTRTGAKWKCPNH